MVERKPLRATFESWVETQIRGAYERGEFENLEGAGKPSPLATATTGGCGDTSNAKGCLPTTCCPNLCGCARTSNGWATWCAAPAPSVRCATR